MNRPKKQFLGELNMVVNRKKICISADLDPDLIGLTLDPARLT